MSKRPQPLFELCLLTLLLAVGCALLQPREMDRNADIPPVEREFRAVWVATVANIDWPSEPGLDGEVQKTEAIAILDSAALIGLNTVVLQVRPQCDALYASRIEPWSYFLSGEQGKAPEPYYDPLAFWIEEAHARGMELHAWFNPYRAHHVQGGEPSPHSIINKRPELALKLGNNGYWWLDPGKEGTQDHSYAVVMDVLRRYDVDGIHFDDYFYPYPSYNDGRDFPDDESWKAYRTGGGKLALADWRRDNVNRFIQRIYKAIKKEKKHVKFGLSPFGIWRPGFPESIRGLDQYDVLYADARLWLEKGWLDYLSPQLYWPIHQVPQSYPVLLAWWVQENKKGRHIWPGLYASGIDDERGSDEIVNQVMVARALTPKAPGHVHFSMKALQKNYGGLADSLAKRPYAQQALVPTSPWLDDRPPKPPSLKVDIEGEDLRVQWAHPQVDDVWRWIVYYKRGGRWHYDFYGGEKRECRLPLVLREEVAEGEEEKAPELVREVAVAALDRLGNESEKTRLVIGR
ncbi:MAG: uncharacterized lipoprotein YddW (UPF0748 family) [Candidatus Latescibacterota bacterium]|jgi:uncharacterized lipoprotein YddW (UPF0748 family)